jgi:hypothetical protein
MIDTWWKWVLSILAGIAIVALIVFGYMWYIKEFYGGDISCAVVRCVITK